MLTVEREEPGACDERRTPESVEVLHAKIEGKPRNSSNCGRPS